MKILPTRKEMKEGGFRSTSKSIDRVFNKLHMKTKPKTVMMDLDR